jgi:4-hydroxy-2-oxoheptanedioate aldolase
MNSNGVREKLKAGESTIGCFLGLGSPNVAELLAHAGYDWLLIETEHNALGPAEVQHMLMAINATNTIPLVRVPSADQVYIQNALDIGALGIMVPMVKTADEARAIVSMTRYPPEGKRGIGGLRSSHYTLDNVDYFNRANDNILVVLIVETKEAAENIDEIASVPGVDALFMGTWDLSLSYGLNPNDLPLPQIDKICDRVLEVCQKQGIACGGAFVTPEQIQEKKKQGYRMLANLDYNLLVSGARKAIEGFRQV